MTARSAVSFGCSSVSAASICAIGALLASPGDAQTLDRSPAVPNEREVWRNPELEAQRTLAEYARCIVARYGDRLDAFLDAPSGSREAERLGRRLARSDCFHGGQLRFVDTLFAGAIYEALYDRDYASMPIPDLAGIRIASDTPVEAEEGNEQAVLFNALERFANCAVRVDAAGTRALLDSHVTEDDETEAFQALMPALNGCLTGADLHFGRPMLRSILAEALYKLTEAAYSQSATSVEDTAIREAAE